MEQRTSNNVSTSVRAVGWLNFFLADVQTGVGPFLAAYLGANHWNPRDAGLVLTLGGLVGVVVSPFAGEIIDISRNKRRLVALGTVTLSLGAILISLGAKAGLVLPAEVLIGAAGAFLAPTVAAITLGIVGRSGFDKQFGKNQSFNSAGNVFTAILLAGVGWLLGLRSLFVVAACLAIPVWLVLRAIDPRAINDSVARGDDVGDKEQASHWDKVCALCTDRVLVIFFGCAFLFHFANAACFQNWARC